MRVIRWMCDVKLTDRLPLTYGEARTGKCCGRLQVDSGLHRIGPVCFLARCWQLNQALSVLRVILVSVFARITLIVFRCFITCAP